MTFVPKKPKRSKTKRPPAPPAPPRWTTRSHTVQIAGTRLAVTLTSDIQNIQTLAWTTTRPGEHARQLIVRGKAKAHHNDYSLRGAHLVNQENPNPTATHLFFIPLMFGCHDYYYMSFDGTDPQHFHSTSPIFAFHICVLSAWLEPWDTNPQQNHPWTLYEVDPLRPAFTQPGSLTAQYQDAPTSPPATYGGANLPANEISLKVLGDAYAIAVLFTIPPQTNPATPFKAALRITVGFFYVPNITEIWLTFGISNIPFSPADPVNRSIIALTPGTSYVPLAPYLATPNYSQNPTGPTPPGTPVTSISCDPPGPQAAPDGPIPIIYGPIALLNQSPTITDITTTWRHLH